MNSKLDSGGWADREIKRRFAIMRQQDKVHLPDVPDTDLLAQRSPLVVKSKFQAVVPMMAAALAAVLVTGALLSGKPAPDPSILYASIMHANIMATDQLMSLSEGTMPGMTAILDLDAMDSTIVAYPQLD
jgi:hypothetical protein